MRPIVRGPAELSVVFRQSGMEISVMYNGHCELEAAIDLFPYDFHESLKSAVDNGITTYPCIPHSFRRSQRLVLERQGGKKNGEVWFTLRSISHPGFFAIELREQEIKLLLSEMREHMTRPSIR